MKKWIAAILTAAALLSGSVSATYNVPEAYMGFSVADDWYIFSKNMENQELLDAVGLTADEVNESLVKSDCEYFITNPKAHSEIYVKVRDNEVTQEFYNILETEVDILLEEMERILRDAFSVDQFYYYPDEIVITPYSQMKFVTIPGTAQYDGKQFGMVYGFTFVNGKGVAFLMQVDTETPGESDVSMIQDIANSVSFTMINEKGETTAVHEDNKTVEEEKSQSSMQYIIGGFAALAFAALCLYLYHCIKHPNTKPKAVRKEDDEYSAD